MVHIMRREARAEDDNEDISLAVRFSNSMEASAVTEEQKSESGSDAILSKRKVLVDDMPVTSEVGHAALPYG